MHNFQVTDYPKIYRDTYWGNFLYDQIIYGNIINNRNQFVIDYKIKAIGKGKALNDFECNRRNGYYQKLFDHCEIYRTHDNKYIFIISPYGTIDDLNKHIDINKFQNTFGFKVIDPLYSKHAITMISIIDNLKQLKLLTHKLFIQPDK